MSEAEAIARSTRGPVTREWLRRDLLALGVKPGMLLMVHASLSQLGWVVGGAETVLAALRDAVGPEGTLVLPAFTSANTNPERWRHPPVPDDWVDVIRAETPAFDPTTWLTREMGAVCDAFLRLPGMMRSAHPALSWAAQGPLAEPVTANHALDLGLGEESPLGRCYQLDGHVLSLGTVQTTILHLAESRAEFPGKRCYQQGSAMLVSGQRQWTSYETPATASEDFELLRQDYMHATQPGGAWSEAQVGYGLSRLFQIRDLVDYAVTWIESHRHQSARID